MEVHVYSKLVEGEASPIGWHKSTVDYVNLHKSEVIKEIKRASYSIRKRSLQPSDIDDIYTELLFYLYNVSDYDIETAINKSKNGHIVDLKAYVCSCISICSKRHISENSIIDINTTSNTTNYDGNLISIFDILQDKDNYDIACVDLDLQCKLSECIRYKYETDLYLLWYTRILASVYNIENKFEQILIVIGTNKLKLKALEQRFVQDEIMLEFAKAIMKEGLERSLEVLEKYVYSANSVKRLVRSLAS